MSIDVEQQVSNYYRWIETRSGLDLRPPSPKASAAYPEEMLIDDLSGFEPPHESPTTPNRAVFATLIVAAAAIVLIAGLAVASQSDNGDDTLSAAQSQSECLLPPVDPPATWDGCVAFDVFMAPSATKTDIDNVRSVLESRSDVVDTSQLEYLDAEVSLDRARQVLAEEPDAADLLTVDNVVTSFRVASTRSAPVDELRILAQDLAAMAGVYDVQAEGDLDPAVTADESTVVDATIVEPGWDDDFDSVDVAADDAVIAVDRDGRRLLRLPVGNADGITVGMPVTNSNGLIGRVETVDDNGSSVLLATDNTFQTGAVVNGTPLDAYVAGDRLTGAELLSHNDLTGAVRVGDLIVTSGGSEAITPTGIPIGVVESISTTRQQANVVHLRLLADPVNDTDVIRVLLYRPAANPVGQPPTTAQQPPTTG